MSLTKTAAKELLESGNKVTHNLFMDHEYIYKKKEHPKSIFAEDGTEMDEDTFWKKFSNNWFQYDFESGEYYRPKKPVEQLSLDLA